MNRKELVEQIRKKKSVLCVGLDTDIEKIPSSLLEKEDPVFEFNKAIIDATHEYTVAYKPNIAFYEALGVKGWQSLEKTINYLNENYPEIFTIADAKRGDIGNTSARYAKAFFEEFSFDSITVAPYMGSDSVQPFTGFDGKWVILLALTSNPGAFDFQTQKQGERDEMLFEKVLEESKKWGDNEDMMYVVGATKADYMRKVRSIVPDNFLLVPGVGAQGGSLSEVMENGLGSEPNLLINSSRGVIYASNEEDFAEIAGKKAKALQQEMALYIK
ncbi:orotidine-5'-phosphate decarboxylase [Owenweeksia hongkongensis]|uniref:orotidine-5'-phosphate decarboxylase n=1 Tax=Owenweeksia hongkongensis TaxID=253245 RepID=UPI003A95DA05